MYEHPSIWRRKIRLQILADIANEELQSGKSFDDISKKLIEEMKSRWSLVYSTRKEYLDIVKKILTKQYVLSQQQVNH